MTIGEALAEARGVAGLTVDEVSERTGIREIVIRSIEQDDFNSLGGALYVRGYLRAIARAVGLDPQPLIREFDAPRSNAPGAPPRAESPGTAAGVPAGEVPTVETPIIEGPIAETPAAEVPAGKVPTVETPIIDAPAGEVPTVGTPIIDAPAPAEPTTAVPTTAVPTTAVPTTAEPASARPAPALDDTVPDWGDVVPDWGEQVPAWGEHASIWGELEPIWAPPATAGEHAVPRQTTGSLTTAGPGQAARPPATVRPAPAARRPAGTTRTRVSGGVALVSVLALFVLGVVGVSSAEIISKLGSSSSHPAAASGAGTPAAGATPTGTGATAGQAAGSATPATSPTPSLTPTPLPLVRLAIRDAQAFGPDGLADGDNPGRAAWAITPGAPGPWRTQWYATPDFGHLKHGTGLLIDMGRRVTVSSVQVQLGSNWGTSLQIRAGDAAVPGQLPVVASRAGAGGLLTVGLPQPVRSRYVLLWFVKLPPTGSGTYRANVYGVVVTGRP